MEIRVAVVPYLIKQMCEECGEATLQYTGKEDNLGYFEHECPNCQHGEVFSIVYPQLDFVEIKENLNQQPSSKDFKLE